MALKCILDHAWEGCGIHLQRVGVRTGCRKNEPQMAQSRLRRCGADTDSAHSRWKSFHTVAEGEYGRTICAVLAFLKSKRRFVLTGYSVVEGRLQR